MPEFPEPNVPSQKASMASMVTPAEPTHSTTASVRRSLTPLSHSSPKGVHPMPTMATRSRIPVLLMCVALLWHRLLLHRLLLHRLLLHRLGPRPLPPPSGFARSFLSNSV